MLFPGTGWLYAPTRLPGAAHINCLEFFAGVIAFEWAVRLSYFAIELIGDSAVALTWLQKGYTADDSLSVWLRQFVASWQQRGVTLHTRWVPSDENPADSLSRLDQPFPLMFTQ